MVAGESMGFDSLWTAEAWGSDALIPLAWYGSRTTTMKLGHSITQISARTAAATAMAMQILPGRRTSPSPARWRTAGSRSG